MNEQIELARRHARKLWRYRWHALLLSALACVGGWTYVISLPNSFEVEAKVFVDTSSMLRPLLKGLAVDNSMLRDSAQLMKRTLLTRPNLEEVARRTDLDLSTTTPREFESLIASLANRIKLSGTERDNVYTIKFEDTDAQRAKRVVDELLNTFLEEALGDSRSDTEVTQQFLDAQIAEYEKRLVEAEERLKLFKQKNVGMVPGAEANYFQRLQAARDQLRTAELEFNEAQRRRDELRKRLNSAAGGGEGSDTVSAKDPSLLAMSSYTERIDAMQSQLDQLLLQYTEKHPDIITLRERIADLETKREAELDELAAQMTEQKAVAGKVTSEAAMMPALAVAESEAQAAAMEARVTEYRRQVEELEKLVDTVPEIEAELTRLDRDYGLNKEQYEQLLQRREAARLSEQVDEQSEDVKLKVIDPPKVPIVPSGPNRVILFSGVFGAALGLGGAFAFLLSQIQPRFYTIEELKELTRLPVLGSVSYQSSRRYRTERRMELAVFLMIFLMLASVYGGLVVSETLHMDLHGKFAAIAGREA